MKGVLVDGIQGVLPGQTSSRVNGLVVTLPLPPEAPTRDPMTYLQLGSNSSAGRAQA